MPAQNGRDTHLTREVCTGHRTDVRADCGLEDACREVRVRRVHKLGCEQAKERVAESREGRIGGRQGLVGMLLAVEVDEGRVRTRLLDDIHGRHDLPEAYPMSERCQSGGGRGLGRGP